MLLTSSSTQPHCSVYCCLNCPNSMGFVSLALINTKGMGLGTTLEQKAVTSFPFHIVFLFLEAWELYNCSKTPRTRTDWKMGLPGSSLLEAGFFESGKANEVRDKSLSSTGGHVWAAYLTFPCLPPQLPSSSVMLCISLIIKVISPPAQIWLLFGQQGG